MGDLDRRAHLLKLIESGAYYAAHECGAAPWVDDYGYPISPPTDIDCVNAYGKGGDGHQFIAISTRTLWIQKEIAGGKLGDKFGVVVGRSKRGKTIYTMGGGQVVPDFREEPGEETLAAESIRRCAVREFVGELQIPCRKRDLLMFGARTITDEKTRRPKLRRGRICADVCFMGCSTKPLRYATAAASESDEVGERYVLSVEELLSSERDTSDRRIIPASQALVLATGILWANEVLADCMPEPLKELLHDGTAVKAAVQAIRQNPWRNLMFPLIQIGPWNEIDFL